MSIFKENPVLESAVKHYNRFSLDRDLLDEYEKREMFLRQQEDLIAQGREEEKINIAKNLLLMNMSSTDISKITGLSVGDVQALADGKM